MPKQTPLNCFNALVSVVKVNDQHYLLVSPGFKLGKYYVRINAAAAAKIAAREEKPIIHLEELDEPTL